MGMREVADGAVIYREIFSPWLRAVGVRGRNGKRSWRMAWGELTIRPGWALGLLMFEEHFSLHVHAFRLNAFITLTFLQRWHRDPEEILETWGASCAEGAIHFNWGSKYHIVNIPWRHWVQTSDDVRLRDGSWAPYVGSWEREKEPDGRHEEIYPYRYLLKSGQWQDVTATIHVKRCSRKLKTLRWLPFKRTRYAIDVRFSSEIGERTGSWKGGCVGCGYELRPDETPRECLKRMERERKF